MSLGWLCEKAKEAGMQWNRRIRQAHRWISILFTLLVAGVMIVSIGQEPPLWVSLLPLLPLALLMLTGLYLFVLPYVSRRQRE